MSNRPPDVLSPPVTSAFDNVMAEPDDPQPQQLMRQEASSPRTSVIRDVTPPAGVADTVSVVRFSPEVGELFAALATAQGKFTEIERTHKARITSKKDGVAAYEIKYEGLDEVLEAVRPALSEAGIAVMQFPSVRANNAILIRTMLGHKSGQWMYNDLTANLVGTDPQAVGSGITYLRRYALKSIVAVAAGWDDDGRAASGIRDEPSQQAPQAAQRRSQQAPASPKAPSTAPVNTAAAVGGDTPVALSNIGIITELAERAGVWFCALDTGYKCATKDLELAVALEKFKKDGKRVELGCKKPRPGFAPTLEQILVSK